MKQAPAPPPTALPLEASVGPATWGSLIPRLNISLEDPVWVSSDPRPRKHTKHLMLHLTCAPCSNAAKDLQVGDLTNSSGRPVGAEFLYYWLLL